MTLSRKRLLEIGAGAGAFGSIAILRRPADAAQFSLKLANDQTPTHPMNVATAEARSISCRWETTSSAR
jgi:hypothetical protein